MFTRYLAIAVGGALGATMRWALDDMLNRGGFHWATFVVNVVGCLLLGFLMGKQVRTDRHGVWLQDFGAIGFCGGLTTMSTFSLDVVRLLDGHRYAIAGVYLFSSVIAGFVALLAGAAIERRVGALENPVEGRP